MGEMVDPSASVPSEDTIKALLDYLVSPLLPFREYKNEKLTEAQQEMVGKQMHAVVMLYNYYHRRHFPNLEFLDLKSFCKICCITKPGLFNYMRYIHKSEEDHENLNEHLSFTEKMVSDACNICKGLDPSKRVPNIEGWPISKVAVFLIDLTEENCVLQFSSMTQGVWSLVEKFLEVRHEKRGERELMNIHAFKKLSSNASTENEFEEALDQLAFSAVEQETGIHHSDLRILGKHNTYSLSHEKTSTQLYIMQYERPASNELTVLPIKDVMRSLEGPIIERDLSSGVELTAVVEHYNLLPYYHIISNWLLRKNADIDCSSMLTQQVISAMKCAAEQNGRTSLIEESASNERKVDGDNRLSKIEGLTMKMSITETPSVNRPLVAATKSEIRIGSTCLEPGRQSCMKGQAVIDNSSQKGKSASNGQKLDNAGNKPRTSGSPAIKMSMNEMPSVSGSPTAGRRSEHIAGNPYLKPDRQVMDDHQATHGKPLQKVEINDNSASTERKVDKESYKPVRNGSEATVTSIADMPAGNGSSVFAILPESKAVNPCFKPERQTIMNNQAINDKFLQNVELNVKSASNERKADKESCGPVRSGSRATETSIAGAPSDNGSSVAAMISENKAVNPCFKPETHKNKDNQAISDKSLQTVELNDNSYSNERKVAKESCNPVRNGSQITETTIACMPSGTGSSVAPILSENKAVNPCFKLERQTSMNNQAMHDKSLQNIELYDRSASNETKVDKESCKPVRSGSQTTRTSIAGKPSGNGSSVASILSENKAANPCFKPARPTIMNIQAMNDHNDKSASNERKVDKDNSNPSQAECQTTETSIAGTPTGNWTSVTAISSENKAANPCFKPETWTIMNNQAMNDKPLQNVELIDNSASNQRKVDKESSKPNKIGSQTTETSRNDMPFLDGSSTDGSISEGRAGNPYFNPQRQTIMNNQSMSDKSLQEVALNDNSASNERNVEKESCKQSKTGSETPKASRKGMPSLNGSSTDGSRSENKAGSCCFQPASQTITNDQVMIDKHLQKSDDDFLNIKENKLKYAITYSRKVARTLGASNSSKIVDPKCCCLSERMPKEEDNDLTKVSKLNEQNLTNKNYTMVPDEHGTTENCINSLPTGPSCAVNILDNTADISRVAPGNLITMKGQSENDNSFQNGQIKDILRANDTNPENVTTCNERVRSHIGRLSGACRSESLSLNHIPQLSQNGDISGRNITSDNYISKEKIAIHNRASPLDSSKKACVTKSNLEELTHDSDPIQDGFTSGDLPLVPVLINSNEHSTFFHVMTSKKSELQQASLLALQKKLEKLHQQQRLLEDEIAFCEMNIRTISSGDANLPAKIDSVIEALNSIYSSEVQSVTYQFSDEHSPCQAIKRRKLSEAVLTSRNPCKELDDICYINRWMLPRYSVLPSFSDFQFTGKFEANLTVQGVDFECSCGGDLKSSPSEARESAAARMLSKLRTMVGQTKSGSSEHVY